MTGLLVTGMHHSGTSVVSGILAHAGWNPGASLVPDDPRNGKRFFEDSKLVDLNRTWLARDLGDSDLPSDWGIREGLRLDFDWTDNDLGTAKQYCRQRQEADRCWLAKDPRTCLTLPIWTQVPNVKFLFVYRSPWDVVESLTRYGRPFTGRSDWLRSVWEIYNRLLLDALEHLGPRALVVSTEAVLGKPEEFVSLVSQWVEEKPRAVDFTSVIDPKLFRNRPEGSHIAQVFRLLHPRPAETLNLLDQNAALPRPMGETSLRRVLPGGTTPKRMRVGIQVVIPCHNDGQYLDEAIASVENGADNLACPVELTIVDSWSTETATLDYFRRLSDNGYQVVRAKRPGLSAARNHALGRSNLEVVIPLDADNRLRSDLFLATEKVLSGKFDVVFGPWQRFGLEGQRIEPPLEITWDSLIPVNTIDACAAISRRLLNQLGGWEESLEALEDWDFWIRAFRKKARFSRQEEVLFDYMVRPHSMTWKLATDSVAQANAVHAVVRRWVRRLTKIGVATKDWGALGSRQSP